MISEQRCGTIYVYTKRTEVNDLNYTLMQKNYAVMDIDIDPVNGRIRAIGEIHELKRIPLGVCDHSGIADQYRFEDWWRSRSIPLSRQGLQKALREMNIGTPDELIAKCLGLSLSDQYWIKPTGSDILWEDINFFDNEFSEDIGNILFGERPSSDKLNMRSPDTAANGWLKKKWKIIDGKRCLVKGGDGFQQQPYNEVIASMIAERLGIDHAKYTLGYTEKKLPVCVSENIVTRDTELVAAGFINMVLPFEDNESKYEHFCRCCEYLKIPNYRRSLDEMMILDHIIANQDRHMGNFAAIRNVDTLEFIGLSPIFDSGTSLRYDTPDDEIDPSLNVESQPFESFHNEQIGLVNEPQRFDLSKLCGIEAEISELFSDNRYAAYMKADRPQIIIKVIQTRIEMLGQILSEDIVQDESEDMEMKME